MKQLIQNIIEWANQKDLIKPENAETQYRKFLEEVGETCKAISLGDKEQIKNEFGDIAVTIIILAAMTGGCNYLSYNFKSIQKKPDFEWFVGEVKSYDVDRRALDYLNDVSTHYGFPIEECLESAWNKIKDRKGKTVNGSFVKEEDLALIKNCVCSDSLQAAFCNKKCNTPNWP